MFRKGDITKLWVAFDADPDTVAGCLVSITKAKLLCNKHTWYKIKIKFRKLIIQV